MEACRLRYVIITALVLAGVAAGCGGDGATESTSTPTVVVSATPTPTPSGPGRVRSTVQARCELSTNGAEVIVTFAAHALGAAELARVQLLLDGETEEDSGAINQRDYRGVANIPVAAGSQHSYRIVAEARNAARVSIGGTVNCPDAPQGPRA